MENSYSSVLNIADVYSGDIGLLVTIYSGPSMNKRPYKNHKESAIIKNWKPKILVQNGYSRLHGIPEVTTRGANQTFFPGYSIVTIKSQMGHRTYNKFLFVHFMVCVVMENIALASL